MARSTVAMLARPATVRPISTRLVVAASRGTQAAASIISRIAIRATASSFSIAPTARCVAASSRRF